MTDLIEFARTEPLFIAATIFGTLVQAFTLIF